MTAAKLTTLKASNINFVAEMVTELLQTASPKQKASLNIALLTQLFQTGANRDVFLCNSTLFERAKKPHLQTLPLSVAERRLSAKLHCLYGVPIQAFRATRSSSTYPFACSKVYDLRNYTRNSMWGPFLDDEPGKVDWEMLEAIMIILGHNIRIFNDRTGGLLFKSVWAQPFVNAVPSSYSISPGPIKNATLNAGISSFEDPYNITGTWMRVSEYIRKCDITKTD